MSMVKALRARLRALLFRRAADAELREEIQFHIETETEKNVRLGMSRDEARRLAIAHFGGVQRVREEHRDVRRMRWIEDFAGDARFAFRALRRTPTLTAAAIVTIALGIGANIAIFSAVNTVVLRPLPFPHADRMMVITEENAEKHWHLQVAAPANMFDWRAGVSDFEDVAGYLDGTAQTALRGRGDPRPMNLALVTGSFFSTLGVPPMLGTAPRFEDSMDTTMTIGVLSYDAWQREFGGDSSVVGKTFAFSTSGAVRPNTRIVGVMPPGFAFPREKVDLWQVLNWSPTARADASFRRAHWLRAIARLRPGATEAHAKAQLQAVVTRLKTEYPGTNKYMGALMMPLHDYLVRDTRVPLLILLGSVAFLLVIVCANVANLLLVQAAGREREASLRLALGANRSRLVRQALTESVVLSVLGGAVGVFVGWAGTHLLVRLQPEGLLNTTDFSVDRTVLFYVLAITVASGLLFGTAPALWTRHRDPASSLKDGGRGAAGGRRVRWWADALVVSEVALALLMAVGAGLLARSFWRVRQVDPGFDPRGVAAIELGVSGRQYDSAQRVVAFMDDLRRRAKAMPGVSNVALALFLPMSSTYTSDFIGYGRPADDYGTEVGHRIVSPDYFSTMRVPLRRGRLFTEEERIGGPLVIVINQALAKSYFKGQDPLGQRLTFDKVPTPKSTWYTVIGIVGDEHSESLQLEPRPEVYQSLEQEPENRVHLLLRARSGDAASLFAPARAMYRELDPTNALIIPRTVEQMVANSTARIRFFTTLMLLFATIGVVLSIVGVYGVLAQSARNRTREMGVRIALGAQSRSVVWLIVRQGLGLTVLGLLIGTPIVLLSSRLLQQLLFEITPTDPVTLIAVTVLLAATSVAAAWVPARRASRTDPAVALRSD